jgi:hypothetical protein
MEIAGVVHLEIRWKNMTFAPKQSEHWEIIDRRSIQSQIPLAVLLPRPLRICHAYGKMAKSGQDNGKSGEH